VIYLDTSVALAQLLAEDRRPPARLWDERLVSSRLLEYELWNRLHARGLGASHGDAARELIGRVALAELGRRVLGRALEPIPAPVSTLDALHLAAADFLRSHGTPVTIATYDKQLARAARRLDFELYAL
jgi:predicted nucleic acid-binding protein